MTASLGRAGPASATLLVVSGPARGSRVEVPAGGLVFGRAAGSAGRLGDDQALSRWHARLDLAGEGLVVEDLASTNGTLLNGQRISGRQTVRPGDVVTIGASQLQALPPPAPAPAQPRMLATTVLPAAAAAHPPAAHPVPAAAPAAHLATAPPARAASPGAPLAPAAHLATALPGPAAAQPVPGVRPPAGPGGPVPSAGPVPGQRPARPGALAQPGSPAAPGLPGLAELPGVQPLFLAVAGRYLGRVTGIYAGVAALLGVLAAVLQVARYRLGVTLPAAVMPGQWARPAAAALALSAGVLVVAACLRTASTRMSLRAGRLDIERGLLRRETTAIDLRQLRRVSLHQTALQRLTGDGTLLLELAGWAGPVPVTGLARGQRLQQIYGQLAALTSAGHR